MQDVWFPLIMGFLVGAVVVGGTVMYIRQDVLNRYSEAQTLSDSAAELLELLAPAGMVLNSKNAIVRVTGGALATGLIDSSKLIHRKLNELVNRARRSDLVEALETELPTKLGDGKLFIAARAKAIGGGNVLLIVDDRTESVRLEEVRKDFLTNISHELKTPIGAIALLAESLEGTLQDTKTSKKLVGNIRKETKRLSALVKDIIQLSRIASADALAKSDTVDLNEVIHEAIDRNSWRSEKSAVAIKFTEPKGKHLVFGDSEMLTVAVKNLIENAIIYSPAESAVSVALKANETSIDVSVADKGIGITKAEQDRIFERFYRVDASRSRLTGGTGLGLSIVKQAAISHHGEIRVTSKPGSGSKFTLRLPVIGKKVAKQVKRKAARG